MYDGTWKVTWSAVVMVNLSFPLWHHTSSTVSVGLSTGPSSMGVSLKRFLGGILEALSVPPRLDLPFLAMKFTEKQC